MGFLGERKQSSVRCRMLGSISASETSRVFFFNDPVQVASHCVWKVDLLKGHY